MKSDQNIPHLNKNRNFLRIFSLKIMHFSIDAEALGKTIDEASEVLNRIESVRQKSKDQIAFIEKLKVQLQETNTYSIEVGAALQNATQTIGEVNKVKGEG
jgi:ribosome-binding protein aMBF1 (putative translation factor)